MSRFLFGLAIVLVLAGVAPTPSRAEGFSGAGSTFAYPILGRWGQAFSAQEGEGGGSTSYEGLDYEPVGSLGGVTRIIQGAVEFGATDVPLPPDELAKHGLVQFPIVTGGVAVVVNLRGVQAGALRLSGAVLSRIYLGEVTRWSDGAIRALNPGLNLPDAPITVVRRSDGSGTTYHFATYLAGASETWRSRIGVDTLLNWPTGVAAKGNQELAERVRATDNAIGYVEASQAARLNLSVVLLENSAGRFVAPNVSTLQAGLATATWDARQDFYQRVASASGQDAYPIVATVYALMQRRPASSQRARRAIAFFRFALNERGNDALALGFVPLPAPVVTQVEQYWAGTSRAAR